MGKSTYKIKILSIIAIVLSVVVDQAIKYAVDLCLKPVGNVVLLDGILQLNYLENDGAMMGMFSEQVFLMAGFAAACLILVCYILYSGKIGYGVDFWSLVFITAGGVGNFIDRIFRGYVIDYIEVLFVDFYVFNFADCLVTCGAFVIIISQIYQFVKDSKNNKTQKEITADD